MFRNTWSLSRERRPKAAKRRAAGQNGMKRFRPQLEVLEDRCLLSADVSVSFLQPTIMWDGAEATTPTFIRDSSTDAGFDDQTVLHVAVDPSEWGTRVGYSPTIID